MGSRNCTDGIDGFQTMKEVSADEKPWGTPISQDHNVEEEEQQRRLKNSSQ